MFMNKITEAHSSFVFIERSEGPALPLPFAAFKKDTPASAAPALEPERFTDAVIGYVKALYELNTLILSVVYKFFEALFGPSAPLPKTEKPTLSHAAERLEPDFITVETGAPDPSEVKKLHETLLAHCQTKVHYSDDENSEVELGTFIFDHLLDQGKGGVEFDALSGIYTVRFPQAKRAPMIFTQETAQKLNGRVQQPVVHLAKVIQFKVGAGKVELLGDSLTASAKVKAGMLGDIEVGATIEALADKAYAPFAETHMLASIRLNEGTHFVVRKIVENVLCPLLNTDLSKIKVRRDPAIRTLYQTLNSHK